MMVRLTTRSRILGLSLGCALGFATSAQTQEIRSDTLFTTEKYLNFEQVADPQISPDGSQIIYSRRHVDKMNDRWESELWIMNADGSKNRFLVKGSGARWSPDGTRIVYTAEGEPSGTQIFVRWMDAEGATSQVTRATDPLGDIRWSPDGKSIGFSMFVPVKSEFSIDMPAAPKGAKWTAAPRFVDKLHYRFDRRGFLEPGMRHIFVIPADGGSPRQITRGNIVVGYTNEGQPGGVGWDWAAGGRSIVFDGADTGTVLKYRFGNIYAADVQTGEIRKLTPTDGAWSGPVTSPDGRRIAFRGFPAKRVSYQASDVYVVNLDGSGFAKATGSLDRDPSGIIWAPDGNGLYFTVADKGTTNVYFSSLGGEPRRITNGTHMLSLASVARSGLVGAGVRSAPKDPPDIQRIDLRQGTYTQLTRVNEDVLTNVRLGDLEELWVTSTGNTKVHGWIVKPPNFQPGRKYPLLFEIHGGPHGMYNVGFDAEYQNFAANGYLVLYTNPRGSTSYGSAFGNAIENNYPGPDYDDLMAAVDTVVRRGLVDTTRMYVGGCSGGGVLSSWVIGHTNRFAAAAVRCPVTNWISMAGTTDITLFTYNFFAKPFWEDPQPWLQHSSLMHVGKVTTPTLVMTGEQDLRTPMPQSEEYFAALKMRGVPTALLRFEGEAHGTSSKPSNWIRTQLYMMQWYGKWRRTSDRNVTSDR
jgi:dipeptidyl aminopeptidase/acylaminoacyl peptidase